MLEEIHAVGVFEDLSGLFEARRELRKFVGLGWSLNSAGKPDKTVSQYANG